MAAEQVTGKCDQSENVKDESFRRMCNEEIIAEVTKDIDEISLESQPTRLLSDADSCNVIDSEHDDDIPEDFDTAASESDSTHKEDDFIDEDALKIEESNFTEEELKLRQKEADDHKLRGNELFKSGEYRESAECYTLALRTCPLANEKQRSVMYCNRAAAKMKLSINASAIEDCTKAIELDSKYLKAYYRRAQLYEIESDKLDEAFADYKKILELNPTHQEALAACHKLPKEIEMRNEKMKTEMLGKLKDLGNMILRPFGLSTNNFQMTPDPSGSGGYSINFNQNAN